MPYELLEDEAPKKNPIGEAIRPIARTASNLVTRGIGLPGDVLSLVNDLAAKPLTKAITGKSIPYEETLLGKAIPTTQTHRAGIEKIAGEYLKPQNKVEQFVDDILEDTSLMLIPGGKALKGAKSFQATSKIPKSFIKSVGANIAGEAAEQISGSEAAGSGTKLGAYFLMGLLNKGGVTKHLGSLFQEAESALPATATSSGVKLGNNLNNLRSKITGGRPVGNLSDSEKFVLDYIDKAEKLIQNGRVNISQLWKQKRSFNDDLSKLYDIKDRGVQKKTKNLAKQVNHWIGETIEDYGKANPNFYKPYKAANEGFGALANSNLISRFVENNLKYTPFTSGLTHLFGRGIGKGAAASLIPYQIGKLGYRIAKSPTLRKYYTGALKAAATQNSVLMNKEIKKLDENLQKDESKDKYEFID